ncbi:hypothetical protein L7F22_042126 [Adiantum nelumboides]|nr:hypothetical protein [Adiantum nelumboides]
MATITRTPPTLDHPIRTLSVRTSNADNKPKMQGRIDIANLTQNNIGQLRKLNSVLFPVRFGEKWYKDVLHEDVKEICKYALFNDIPVGNICCRFEKDTTNSNSVNVHIMTLGCLAPYRRMGIATTLLEYVLEHAAPGKKVDLSDEDKTAAPVNPNQPQPKKTSSNRQNLTLLQKFTFTFKLAIQKQKSFTRKTDSQKKNVLKNTTKLELSQEVLGF